MPFEEEMGVEESWFLLDSFEKEAVLAGSSQSNADVCLSGP